MSQITPSPAPRQLWLDSLKGLGILLVVAGHFMEQYRLSNPFIGSVFFCIYLFHMALFCLCSGLVAKFDLRKIFTQTLWLYLLFQLVMLVFRAVVLRENFAETGGLAAAVFLPWRHLWYLYALFFWQLTLPLLERLRARGLAGSLAGFGLALFLGLASGYFRLPFSLVRVFSFYPFFAFGVVFAPQLGALAALAQHRRPLRLGAGLALLLCYGGCFAALMADRLNREETVKLFQDGLYGDGFVLGDRAVFYAVGLLTCLALICLCANAKAAAPLGRRTLPLYLLHLPILAALIEIGAYEPLRGGPTLAIVAFVALLTIGCTVVLSSRPVAQAFQLLANVWYRPTPKNK